MKKLFLLSIFAISPAFASDASTIACFDAARASSPFVNRAEAAVLCAGVRGNGPVDCYNAADRVRGLSRQDRLQLCQGATSISPVECYDTAVQVRGFSRAEALQFCRGGSIASLNCYHASQSLFGFSPRNQMLLCAGALDNGPVDCVNGGERTLGLSRSDLLELCRVRDRFRP